MSEKTILEQALLQVQTLEEAVKQNAKGILASTMKQELSDLLKESLEEEEKVEESTEVSEEESIEPKEEEKDMSEQPEDEDSDDEVADDDESDDDSENDDTLDNEDPSKGIDTMDSDDEMSGMPASDADMSSSDELPVDDDDVMDMTSASDEEVLKVFKAMKPEDGIVVKKDGDNVSFEDGNDEYIIKLDQEGDESIEEEKPMDEESWNEEEAPMAEEDSVEEESLYEIELGEDEDVKEEKEEDVKEEKEEEKESEKVEATEAARTKWNIHGDKGEAKRAGLKSKKVFKAGSGALNEEVENLKKQNAEYKKALVLFKEKLNEVAVFNANLAYATRLFTEHSTTKQEKLNILKRFDSVSTLNESKNLFNTIKTELGSKTTVTETVVEKISTTPQTSSSQEVLAEAKAYENPQFKRMKDLMSKIK